MLEVAVSTWPDAGAIAKAVFTSPVVVFSAAEVSTLGLGYVPLRSPPAAPVGVELGVCQVAVLLDVAVRTWPVVGAVAAELLTLPPDTFSAPEAKTVGLGYDPLKSPPAVPVGVAVGVCQVAVLLEVAVST